MTSFPEGWFFIKNQSTGYLLSTEKAVIGEPVVISSLKNRDYEPQLWRHGEDGRLYNKKTNFVLDIAKGNIKAGTEIVQQHSNDQSNTQNFKISSEGHIYVPENPNLVLGIKESFFARKEGLRVHLQLTDKNSTDRKEQLWSFVSPVSNPASVGTPIASLKRTISGASLGSTTSTTSTHAEETCLDEHAHSKLNNFPDTAFFLKSESTGHFIGVETSSVNSAGGKLSLEPLRKNNFESQLWIFDAVTNRLVNKNSGFFLSAENLSEDSSICQSADSSDQGFKLQAWTLSDEGEIRLKHDENWVLGFKQDSWFGLNREGANVLLQKKASDSKQRKNQRFVIVLPIFKKTTSEIVTVSEQIGLFPDGFFFIKNQKQGLVLTVLDSDKLAAEVLVTKLDTEHYNRQLWRHKDGFLFNKASKLVLDVKGGCVVSGTELCQYTQKKENNDNQLWGLTPEGYIHSKNHKDIVLAIDGSKVDRSNVFITHKKTPDHQEQRWNFVLPVFKQKSSTVTETTVKKCVCYHHFAEYPSGWFLIRSFVNGTNAAESPLVLTADSKSNALTLTAIDKSRWRNQLWMYWHGVLINFQTQLAISANDANIGSFIHQDTRQANSINQRWNLTTDGFLIHGSNPSFALVPEATNSAATEYRLVIDDHITSQKEHRFGLLTPRIVVKDDVQTLESWTVTLLTEWKRFNEQSVQKVVHRIANWPEQPFFIGAHDGLALAPEKSEAFAFVVLKKMASGQSEHFKWVFRDGFLVHCATGLVLHASDNLVGGSQLQIREKLVVEKDSIDQRQRWLVKTDGTIVSELKNDLGFALLQQGASYLVQLAYVSNTSTHYNWDFMHGHYESRYSEVYKKQVDVIVRTEKILLTVRSRKAASSSAKLVTQTVGVFPSDWFYIRSKANSSLVLTSPNGDKGTKLTVSKIDYKSFRQQLWHYVDDGCLVNLASDYVIDVAGGALNEGSSLIQWSEKYLKRNRQNQLWTFSVDGHLHPQSRPGLVIGVKGGKVFDGAELQLVTRGSLDLEYQLWSFATPVFGRNGPGSISISSTGDFKNDSEIFVSTVNETEVETSSYETYERTSEVTVVRRWGIFPEGGFFIRINYGDEKLALTVQKKPRVGEKGQTEHEVSLQPLDYKDYLWQFWAYRDGHLINAKTGLALDASITKGLLVEDGLQTLLFVREKSMSVSQFWSLTVDGEIHLRSDQHLVVGISNSRRASVPGAQVGLRELRVKKFVNDKGQRETALKSEKWLRWVFSKPVYAKSSGSTTTTSKTTTTTNTTESNVDFVVSGAVLESVSEETLAVTEKEEAGDDYLLDSDSDSDDDSSISSKSSSQSSTSVLDKLAIATAGTAAIATAGAGILNSITVSSPEQTSATVITDEKGNTQTIQKKTSYKSLKNDRKESFHLSIDYVPTGFEKVVRYKTHQKFNFPSAGYFLIKSYLHGYVLDVVETVKEGAKVVIAPMKVTDYASQLWSFQNGRLVNLKSKNLVLDASLSHKVSSGEKLVLSAQNKESNNSDQHWEFGAEGGLIYLKGKRNLVLTIKDLKIASGTTSVDLFIQEEKSHLKDTHARPEQRWEIKVPSLIPIEQTNSTALDIGYTVIEAGKISVISSSISAIIAFKWLKETFCHKVTTDNQWPSSENWFFIRVGNENAYLASGERDSEAIQFVKLGENEDHKRFLWVYIDGYLVNYKHMLRLTYDKTSNKLLLSSSQETIDQVFTISSSGQLSVNINSQTTYFSVTRRTEVFEIVTSTEKITETSETSVQLHIPVYSDHEVENSSKIAIAAASSWVQSTQKKSSTIQTTITQHHGLFPTATWFFVKVATTGTDSLVLTVKEASTESGASLVLKKLNFKDYKAQLWTFRDNLLINYGSKLVIDVEGNITHSSKIVQSAEAGSSSQKWALTAEGQIHLDSYSNLAFGYESETLQEDTAIVLVSRKETENTKLINWRFSVPVFGKATLKKATVTSISSVTTTVASSIERISECIEQGAIIESVEEADIKVVDNFVKKNTTVAKVESGSSTSTQKSHGFQEILKDVGIAVTAGALGAAVIGTVSKVADKITEQKTSKEQTTVVSQEKKEEAASTTTSTTSTTNTTATTTSGKNSGTVVQNTSGSAVTDQNKKTETIIVRKSQKTSVEVIEESRVIIHAWKIVFTQRVHQCKTKSELIQTIKESREELFRRLDEHLRVHASVDQLISGSVPTWHLSIQQVKEIYRARVFDKFLEHLKSQEVSTVTDIDFEKVVSSVTEEVDSHYQLIIQEQEKTTSESSKVSQEVSKKSESTVHENVIVTIDTIKVTVRYWLIELYEAISVAQKKGSSVEEINTLVESSHKKLLTRLEEIKSSVSTHLESSSSSVLISKKSSINQSVEAAIKLTEATIASHVSTIVSKKQYTYTEESWQNTVRITEEHLSEKLNVYQTAITQEISEVQKSEIDQTQKAEISVVLDEKMVSVAQKTVTEKLVETQTRLSSWFTEISQQITLCLEQGSEENIKKDTLALVEASQIEVSTRIEETKLVLRAYYANLTYLSWAERRRIEYSLDNIKASIVANINQFKKHIESSTVSKEDIIRYTKYSFGASVSRIALTEVQKIVTTVTQVSEVVAVKKDTEVIEEETKKVSTDVSQTTGSATKATETIEISGSQTETSSSKATTAVIAEKEKVSKVTKVSSDVVESEVEQTKVSEKKETVTKPSSSSGIKTAVIGAAAAAIASATIAHHYEGKDEKKTTTDSTTIAEKPSVSHANVIVGKASETIHVEEQTKVASTKKEKSESLTLVYTDIQTTYHTWFSNLTERVTECAKNKGSQSEIETIIANAQEELVISIEKAKRSTTTIIGTSQTSFHKTLSWLRTTAWSQTNELKQIGVQISNSSQTKTEELEEKINVLKKTTFESVDSAIEQCKTSASVIHSVGHASSADISVGKKYEGVDYTKTSHAAVVEKSKVSVGIAIEETRVTIQNIFSEMSASITERRKQGGENVETDISNIIKESRSKIETFVQKAKSSFEEKIKVTCQESEKDEVSKKTQIELVEETNKKLQLSLDKVQESVLVQVSKVEELTVTSSTVTTETEVTEKLQKITQETTEKVNTTLEVSETVIGHHIEVVAESQHTSVSQEKTQESHSKLTLGAEYGLVVVSETTKAVSSKITDLVETITHRVSTGTETVEQDVKGYITVSEQELDRLCDEAKKKVSYELSMVSSHEKSEEEHFIAAIEEIRVSAKTRISQIKTTTITHKEEAKTLSEKLVQIAEESRHDVRVQYESTKQAVITSTDKVAEKIQGGLSKVKTSTQEVIQKHEEKKEDHQSKVDLAKKVLAASAAVAAGTAIAVEIAKKVSEHKQEVKKNEEIQKQTVIETEEVKVQFDKWISSLTETVVSQTKKSEVSTVEITETIEKSKVEFIEMMKKTKSSSVFTEKHQIEVFAWIEETATYQANRIQEIAVNSTKSSVVDVESALQVIKLSTVQEVHSALEHVKKTKENAVKFIGVTTDQLKQKESALLDIKSELVLVTQYVRTSLVTFFKTFTKTAIERIEVGGENVEKDIAILIAETRKKLETYTEEVKQTATKRLSALETKSAATVVSVAALSGIATAEIIHVIKSSEELILQKINRVHSSVWYIEKNQSTTKIVETITNIETETSTEITEKVECTKHTFAESIYEHHAAGHITVDKTHDVSGKESHTSTESLQVSLTVQEIKVTIREWLRDLAEKVSVCAQHGGSSEEIDAIITTENKRIFEYLEISVTKISETHKSEEKLSCIHSTMEKVKSSITSTLSEVKTIGIEASKNTHSYGGFDQMTTVITKNEHQISEVLVTCETTITGVTTIVGQKNQTVEETKVSEKQKVSTKSTFVIEYLLLSIRTIMEELMIEVSECSKREHNITIVTQEVNTIVSEFKEYISVEFNSIIQKVKSSKKSSSVIQETISLIEWTRGMILQSSSQVQSIGINAGVSFNSTGGYGQMRPLVDATITQIEVALGRCDKTLKIEVETTNVYYEKWKSQKECRKQKYEAACSKKTTTSVSKDSKQTKESKVTKQKKTSSSSDSCSSSSESESESDSECEQKTKKKVSSKKEKKEQRKQSSKIFDSCSESDSEDEKDAKKKKKKASTGIAIGVAAGVASGIAAVVASGDKKKDTQSTQVITKTSDVKVIVSEWYEQLITEVSKRAKKGGSSASTDIEIIVQKYTKSITETLNAASANAHLHVANVSTVQQYRASIEWVKNLVIQSSYQVKMIGIQSALSANSKTGGIEQMRPIATSIQQQVNVEISHYEFVTQTQQTQVISKTEHKKNTDTVCSGRQSAVARKEYCEKLEQHVSEVVAESKVIITAWFAQLVRDISICVHTKDTNVNEEVTKLIEKAKLELNETITRTHSKLVFVKEYESDETVQKIESHVKESLNSVSTLVNTRLQEIQEVTSSKSETEITEKLTSISQTTKSEITETLEVGYKHSVSTIETEKVQTESTVVVVDTVEEVKTVVAFWHTKLSEQIHAISIDEKITNKEEKIALLVKQATTEINRVTAEAKKKITNSSNSIKTVSKEKEEELLKTIDYVNETFTTDVKKIQQVSVEEIKKTNTNVKEKVEAIVKTSGEKINHAVTGTAAVVVGAATAAIAIHEINKHNDEKKKQEQEKVSTHGEWSVDVHENVQVMSEWFKLFTKKVSGSVTKKSENVEENITTVVKQAEQEIDVMISNARAEFIKRLSHESLDQESYNYACKQYEQSLETVKVSIVTEIYEVKKVAIESHKSGSIEVLETRLNEIAYTSTERIKTAMGSAVVISQKAKSETEKNTGGSAIQIHVEDENAIVVGEQDIDFERKEENTEVLLEKKKEKVEEKQSSFGSKFIAGSLAIGSSAAALIYKKNGKEKKEEQKKYETILTDVVIKQDTGVETVESVNTFISNWFTSLIQHVSKASKSGASAQEITSIVEIHRTKLTEVIEVVKKKGTTYCATSTDKQEYLSKIDWAVSVASNQATQIQQIGINASTSKTDLSSQMQALVTASHHQIEVTLEQLKSTVKFEKKVTEVTETGETVHAGPVCGKMTTEVDKTKTAYTIIQETRVTTIAMFAELSEKIVARIKQGGENVHEDITKMVETTESQVTKVFEEAKSTASSTSEKVSHLDKKTRLEVEEALTSVHKTVQEQITEVKKVSVEVVTSTTTSSEEACKKIVSVSESSKQKIEYGFVAVATAITASLAVAVNTAKKATDTVQEWYSSLRSKIDTLLEASDCTEEEKKQKISVVISEAEVEMNTKITKLQEQTVTTTTTEKTEATQHVSTDHHLDVFFGNIKSSAQSQLEAIKTAVNQSSSTQQVSTTLQKSEAQLSQEVKTHYEAVEKVTSVEKKQEEKSRYDNYKDTIEKVALGSAAVAAAAALAISYHKNNQQKKATVVETVQKTSVQEVQSKVDNWFSSLTQKITACTSKGGENTTAEVNKIVEEAQAELEVTISKTKTQYTSTTTTTSTTTITEESHRSFVDTLDWIKATAVAQATQITQIVSHGSTSAIDLKTQIENHVAVAKQQIDSALEVHCEKTKVDTIESEVKNTKVTEVVTEKKETEEIKKVEVVTETREQTKERVRLEMTVVVQESKVKINNWLILLLENITTIVHGNSETIRKDILTRLETAEKELDVFIPEIKNKFLSTNKTSATSQVDTETHTLVVNSQKQTLDCVDSIRSTLLIQISVLREVITRIEVEDIEVIIQQVESIIERTKQRVEHTLEHSVEVSISAAFEGKVVTWSEASTIPESFKNVNTFAFDVVGTVVNYHKTLQNVWKQIISTKKEEILHEIKFNCFIEEWYESFSDIKKKKKGMSDDLLLHEALVRVLKRYYIKDSLTDFEVEQLCDAWRKIDTYSDAQIGIRRIKSQLSGKYTTVAISDRFNTRTMVDLAKNNHLCWHSQFSADMFASSSGSQTESESVISGTIRLLGLENASQLAIVSSSPEMIVAARKQGCQSILVEREEEETKVEYDVKVGGLDILGESIQSYVEHESMVQTWSQKEAPQPPRVLIQHLKYAA